MTPAADDLVLVAKGRDMTKEELVERFCKHMKKPTPEILEVLKRWEGFDHAVKVNGKWRLQGFITWMLRNHELLRCVDPSLPSLPLHDLFDLGFIARIWGIPPEELGLQPPTNSIGKPGRPATTTKIAEFADERRPHTPWKAIYAEWNQLHPDDPSGISFENFKEAHRRFRRKDQ